MQIVAVGLEAVQERRDEGKYYMNVNLALLMEILRGMLTQYTPAS